MASVISVFSVRMATSEAIESARFAAIKSAAACTPAIIDKNRFNRMYGQGSKARWRRMCSCRTVLVRAQAIITAKKVKTKSHEPIAFRILSTARSPRDS